MFTSHSDPLSAVDAHVGKHLFEHAIKTALAGKTRILVTHALHFLPQVDYIYCLEQGRITESGTYTELQERKGAFSRLVDEFGGEEAQEQEKEEAEEQDAIDGDKATKEVKSDKHVLIQEEERAKGSVSLTGALTSSLSVSVGFLTMHSVRQVLQGCQGKVHNTGASQRPHPVASSACVLARVLFFAVAHIVQRSHRPIPSCGGKRTPSTPLRAFTYAE